MRVFITGATGYVGSNVAKTLRREGHEVWGLTRSQVKADRLARNEIIPVISDLQAVANFKDIAASSDVIIHAAIDYKADTAALDAAAVKALLKAASNADRPKTFIYTSGVWVYGNSENQPLNENSPLAPIEVVLWRPEVEEIVLKAESVNGLVIRPAIVYGKSGGLTGMWFEGASDDDAVQIVGDGLNRWAMVHVDDLAEGYLLAALSGFRGEAFNFVDDSQYTVMELASAAAQAAGDIRHLEFIPFDKAKREMGSLAEALALNQVVDASKAKRLLGWEPKHPGFIPEVDTYYRAWRAGTSDN